MTLEVALLPFLKNNKMQSGVMVKQRQPDESAEPQEPKDLESMVKQAIEHYKANDFKQLASCVKDIISHCQSDSEPEAEEQE